MNTTDGPRFRFSIERQDKSQYLVVDEKMNRDVVKTDIKNARSVFLALNAATDSRVTPQKRAKLLRQLSPNMMLIALKHLSEIVRAEQELLGADLNEQRPSGSDQLVFKADFLGFLRENDLPRDPRLVGRAWLAMVRMVGGNHHSETQYIGRAELLELLDLRHLETRLYGLRNVGTRTVPIVIAFLDSLRNQETNRQSPS